MYTKKITYNSLFENVQQAKDFLYKEYAKKYRKEVKDLDEDIKKDILRNPDWIEIRDLNAKTPGYTYLLTKFFFEEGATMDMVKSIHEKLLRFKQNLNELPMTVDQYAKVEKTTEDSRPGWERLEDDLNIVEQKRALKDLTNEFASELKDDYKKATKDQVNALMDISNRAKERGEDCFQQMLGYNPETQKYNLRVYKTVQDFIDASNQFLENYDKLTNAQDDMSEAPIYSEEIKELGSSVKVLYRDKDYLSISTRTGKAQAKLFGDKWCIGRATSTFWSYGGGKIQLNTFNFTKPVTDKYSLIGMTISTDGKVTDSADKFNSAIPNAKGTYFWTVMEKLDYPAKVINTLKDDFPKEVKLRLAMENFHKFSDDSANSLNPRKIVTSLVSMNQNIAKGIMSTEEWEEISADVSRLIFDEMGLKPSDFLEFFKDNGIFTESMWNVFDEIIGNAYAKDDMEKIYTASNEGYDDIELIYQMFKKKGVGIKKEDAEVLKDVIDRKDEFLKAIKARIK
jgi:hypothetical protein